ncbi:MAG: aminotransferase class V-fold PLP-dependent enzyme [Verrucomicrobia subdivision 3 bacterium]|nr:aminotransferase class V-fold PLP-dependent enzyme [Limisphaerales bacterium]
MTPPNFWALDPNIIFLNHGSFGSCPRPVLECQQQWRERMERQPIQFFVRDLEGLLDEARSALAEFLGAQPDNLVFVPNATAGVNTVLNSLNFAPGDEIIVTDHEYNACRNALDVMAERNGVRVATAKVPFPLRNKQQPEGWTPSVNKRQPEGWTPSVYEREIIGPILERISDRTRLLLIDHVTSQTGLIFPLERLLREFSSRGIDTLVDGAHAPGMIPLNLEQLGAAYYTGNCHKWICAPKGAGFLYARPDRQGDLRPLSISHGANSPRTDRSPYLIEFGWTGTWDPSAYLSVPEAIRQMGGLFPGGWPELMRRNRDLALQARRILCAALQIPPPCPDEMIGSLAAFPLPDAETIEPPRSPLYLDPLQDRLLAKHAIEVPIIPWPAAPHRVLRISAQAYNSPSQYEQLACALKQLL